MTDLRTFDVLMGAWTTEMTHPMTGDLVVRGSATFEWLEGERFVISRSRTDHPDFPDGITIIGGDGPQMHYFDSRGVQRIYDVAFDGTVLTFGRDDPDFSQRFTGTLVDDGRTIDGLWTLSRDGRTWDDDLRIIYRRSD